MDEMSELRRIVAQGMLTVHAEGGVVQLRVNGVLVWEGSVGSWAAALAKPRTIKPIPFPPTPKVA